jgi:hypothetical protein
MVKRALLLLLLAACGSSPPEAGDGGPGDPDAGVDPSEALYDPAIVLDVRITLPQASIDALGAAPDVYAIGDIQVGDETVTDVGVRLKGEWNFRGLDAKASFKIKFDEFVAGQELRGLRRMTLNGALEDPAYVAERLVYTAFRAAEVPAPRANSARVWVNGELFGLYVNIETEDKTFLRRWFADDDGNLYEEMGAELVPGNEGSFELETNETANDRSDLAAFIAAIDAADDATLDTDLEAVLDVDEFFRCMALEGIVNQWDGYGYTQFGPNNFRIYHDPSTGRFSFIPWGMDMALKPWNGADDLDLLAPTGMILQRCFAGESCRARYLAVVREMTELVDALDLPAQADAMYAQIAAHVAEDPRKEITVEVFEETFAHERAWLVTRGAGVRATLP